MNYHNITYPDMNNGNGLRVVLWLSGCEHCCKGCQNPQTWDKNSGILFDKSAKNELFSVISEDYINGITFSGGDPLHVENREELTLLIKELKNNFPKKTIWLYTGYLWEKIKKLELIQFLDVLIDGPYIESKRNIELHWVGSSNQRVIDVQKSLKENKVILWKE